MSGFFLHECAFVRATMLRGSRNSIRSLNSREAVLIAHPSRPGSMV